MEYEVGKYYTVKCAIYRHRNGGYGDLIIPVLGVEHTDKQLGFAHRHIHIDGRFVNKKHFEFFKMNKEGKTNSILCFEESPSLRYVAGYIEKRLLCKRNSTGINPSFNENDCKGKRLSFFKWVDGMIGKSCKGKKCPHLGTEMFEVDGKFVCPLHNLVGDKRTELITGIHKC